jgi:excinuclease ABC subunit A
MSDFESLSPREFLIVKGARMHNLKNIDIAIPRNKLVVVTGVSGSGKSSLVFDTIYAEGQRRYVESLSAYARQFMGKLNKPDVDYIKGIAPATAIEQKVNTRNPRSTVGTSTEIYDYLKLLFARVGKTYSPVTGIEVKAQTVTDVVDYILSFPDDTKVLIYNKIKKTEGRTFSQEIQGVQQRGYTRLLVDNEPKRIDDLLEEGGIKAFEKSLKKDKSKSSYYENVFLLIDRVTVKKDDEDNTNRISDSVQTTYAEGDGACYVKVFDEEKGIIEKNFNNKFEADGILFEIPSVQFFSFNNPYGACQTCQGFGSVLGIDENLVIPDTNKSVFDDAVAPWRGNVLSSWKEQVIRGAAKTDFPIHRSYSELNEEEKDLLWKGCKYFGGINDFFAEVESQLYKIQYRVLLSRYRGRKACPDCRGSRLRKDAQYVKLKDIGNADVHTFKSITDIVLMSVDKAWDYFKNIKLNETETKIASRILIEITNRLGFMHDVGLGYLNLNRLSNSLSGGESQRINLATSLGSSLVGSLYILDEPSIGLHPRDTQRLLSVLVKLRDLGNTVIVVEHEEDIMRAADQLIDIGPLAGVGGGHLVAQGTPKELIKNNISLTAKYLNGSEKIPVPKVRRKWNNFIEVVGAKENNLKNINVKFPLHTLTVVTGVSGSGKTSLVKAILYPALKKEMEGMAPDTVGRYSELRGDMKTVTQIEMVDQNPIGKSSRSNPVTYVKAYDAIRTLYSEQPSAKARGFAPAHFSFNVDGGRCDNCKGEGEITVEMQFMADVHLQCDDCKGKRFKPEILDVTYKDKNIFEVLCLTIDEAIEFFEDEKTIINRIKPLQEVGLGYVQLGQSSNTLSGGEAQRIKLASFLGKGANTSDHVLFIFDEPTTGLHFHDVNKLLASFNGLINHGHSIIVIEHNIDIIKSADWAIDLGPEGGDAGGNLVFEGTPEGLAECKESYTAPFLKARLR